MAEDSAVLAGVQTDVEPDTELHGSTAPEPVGDGVVEQPPAASDTVDVVPALAETLPTVDGESAAEEPTVEEPAEAPAAAKPRRRRAASRPAGPPV